MKFKNLREGIFKKYSFFFSFLVALLIAFSSLLSVFFAPDKSPNADTINKNLPFLSPFSANNIIVVKGNSEMADPQFEELFPLKPDNFMVRNDSILISDNKLNAAGIYSLSLKNYEIQKHYSLFGTDRSGRDIFSRVLVGGRISLFIGLLSVFLSCLIGTLLGLFSGYYGGWPDKIISWVINVFWSFPAVLLAMVFTLTLGKSLTSLVIAISLGIWVDTARVIRGETFKYKNTLFVEAAGALGFKDMRIIFLHILPNCIGSLIVVSISNFASAILIEAGLSFLGQGIQPPTPSWGGMIYENKQYLFTEHYSVVLIPVLMLTTVVLCFTIMGNTLRDYYDAKAN